MIECNHCHTRYGGIRGISAGQCPRCMAEEDIRAFRLSLPAAPPAQPPWHSLQLAVSGSSAPSAPHAVR